MKSRIFILIYIVLTSIHTLASEISESFSSRTQYESGTAVWNLALGKIHPTLQVVNYKGATSVAAIDFSVGDGSHGSFEPSTYSQFSVNGDVSGNKIRLDLSTYPILKVTSFYLASGWQIEPVGSTPLIIYSQSTVRIEGDIHCEGSAGGNATGATAGTGGTGRCGGKAGGDGGSVSGNGTAGTNASSTVTGGAAGRFPGGASAVGGGGGGSWNRTSLANPGPNAGAFGGTAGASVSDPEFTTIAGGAGGGGGSGTNTNAGAGGGAGGGVVIIHAVGNVNIGTSPSSTTGFIYASGGKGGNSNATGGPGGGGGGGSIQIYSAGTVNIYNTDATGASQALQGSSGSNAVPESGATGGPGRSWVASVGYNGVGTYTPSEESPVVADVNTVKYSTAQQEIVLKSQDLSSTLATIDLFTFTPTSNDFSVEYRASRDNFQSDDTGWVTNSNQVANKRYLKLKLLISTSTPASATMIDQVSVSYTKGERKDFDMKSSGCGSVKNSHPPKSAGLLIVLFLIPVLALLHKRHWV